MMLQWTEELVIDDGDIDREHRDLFQLSNRILSADRLGISKEEIAKLVAEYVDYMAVHFSHEEQLMHRERYPEKGSHIAAHDSFFVRLSDYMAAFETNDIDIKQRLSAHVGTYAWNHIQTYDKALAVWLRDRAAVAA